MAKRDEKKADGQGGPDEVGRVITRNISTEMKESYLDYAMSVITARALPDVRDGLKPVHRRILFAMREMGLTSSARFRKSAAIVGECFVKDTLVSTATGLRPIQDIQIGEKVYTQTGEQMVTNTFRMPKRELLHVELENGLLQTVTPTQQLKVLTPERTYVWKDAKNLREGDYLVLRSVFPNNNRDVVLPKFCEKEMILNSSLAYMLGMLISDGWVAYDYGAKKQPRIGFCASQINILHHLCDIFRTEFNYAPVIERKKDSVYVIRINSLAITRYIVTTFFSGEEKLNAFTKYIPRHILTSPKKVVFSFISGLFDGDGCIKLAKHALTYTTISPKLSQQLLTLLAHNGIDATCHRSFVSMKRSSKINVRTVIGRHPAFFVECCGNNAERLATLLTDLQEPNKKLKCVVLMSERKRIKRSLWNNFDLIPYGSEWVFGELSDYHRGGGWYQDVAGENFRMGITHAGGSKIRYSSMLMERPLRISQIISWGIENKLQRIGSPLYDFFSDVQKSGLFFKRVRTVVQATAEETYDIEVEGEHEFLANGVVSHNCMGKYHPHGDTAIYDSLVGMAQDFRMRYPLITPQGNFGSIDGDPPAAMRYTESKMARLSSELLRDLDKNTVEWRPNYDATRKEPVTVPAVLPNLMLNGTLGIAVGMATNIPPHNLREVCEAVTHLIDNESATTEDLLQYIKGPDFPTAGIVFGAKDMHHAYANGRGGVVCRGVAEIAENKKGDTQILITSIPYRVNKADLITSIATLVRDKKLDGIKGLRDESAKQGMRIVIDLKATAHPQTVLNFIYKHTQLEDTFHFNMVALLNGVPQMFNLKSLLQEFVVYRISVVKRRTQFDLERALEREHILLGLKKALDHIDEIIKLIKASKDAVAAHANLMKEFKFSERQATAILEMRLQRLAGLERKKVEDDLRDVQALIEDLRGLLASPKKIREVIKTELREAGETYGDERRTRVMKAGAKLMSPEDLIPDEESVLVLTAGGYIKRTNPSEYKKQKRGGVGVIDLNTKEEDFVTILLTTTTHSDLLFFTDTGKAYQIKMYDVPEGKRATRGKSIMNFLPLSATEKVTSVLPMPKKIKESVLSLLMVTEEGTVKRAAASSFHDVRRSGLLAIKLTDGDRLIAASFVDKSDSVILATAKGQSIRFKVTDVREMGRNAAGVRGIKLGSHDVVIGAGRVEKVSEKDEFLVLSENGHGKKTSLKEYKIQNRGGSGIKTFKNSSKTGKLMISEVVEVSEDVEVVAMSKKGQVIRVDLSEIPSLGRQTQGVRVMRLRPGDSIASVICL
ncbi:MAG: DNA gyrase subunit A [Parcubacteria group bacterium Greene0714_4]|nr:MAG: DNA gyrase subunit A [Parcubacteria group bacterium Greene0714_4]